MTHTLAHTLIECLPLGKAEKCDGRTLLQCDGRTMTDWCSNDSCSNVSARYFSNIWMAERSAHGIDSINSKRWTNVNDIAKHFASAAN